MICHNVQFFFRDPEMCSQTPQTQEFFRTPVDQFFIQPDPVTDHRTVALIADLRHESGTLHRGEDEHAAAVWRNFLQHHFPGQKLFFAGENIPGFQIVTGSVGIAK